jgi:hypothetical protein
LRPKKTIEELFFIFQKKKKEKEKRKLSDVLLLFGVTRVKI